MQRNDKIFMVRYYKVQHNCHVEIIKDTTWKLGDSGTTELVQLRVVMAWPQVAETQMKGVG